MALGSIAIFLIGGCSAPPRAGSPTGATDTGEREVTLVPGERIEGGVVPCADPSLRETAPLGPPTDPGEFFQAQEVASQQEPTGWGVTVADLDDDGHLDALLPQDGPPLLFFGDGSGRLAQRDDATPTVDDAYTFGASAADYDGDGDLDLLLARLGSNRLWRNDGQGRFTDVTEAAGLGADAAASHHAAWGDYDGDADLDLVVINHLDPADEWDGEQGQPNALWENLGDGTFADRSALLTWRDLSIGFSYMGGWWDLDDDRRPELLVVNDKGHAGWKNAVARWDGAAFVDVGAATGLDLAILGMGLGANELNGDGRPDFLVTDWGALWFMLSDGEGGYYDATLAHGLDFAAEPDRAVAWGAELEDLDNDGDVDLVVAFGNDDLNNRTPNPEVGESSILQHDTVWLQGDDGSFTMQADGSWLSGDVGMGRGFALADIDGNGWLDVIRRNLFGAARYQLARCGAEGWLEVALAGPAPNARGIGARVEVVAGERVWTRWIQAGSTNLGSSLPPVAHFGLGELDQVDLLRVVWPDGGEQRFEAVETRQRVRVTRD